MRYAGSRRSSRRTMTAIAIVTRPMARVRVSASGIFWIVSTSSAIVSSDASRVTPRSESSWLTMMTIAEPAT